MGDVIRLRPALPQDSWTVWKWRNDELTRAMSRTSDKVRWEAHTEWYSRALADPQRTILLAEKVVAGAGSAAVGMAHGLRFCILVCRRSHACGHEHLRTRVRPRSGEEA